MDSSKSLRAPPYPLAQADLKAHLGRQQRLALIQLSLNELAFQEAEAKRLGITLAALQTHEGEMADEWFRQMGEKVPFCAISQ
jgi:hypothetical protein